MNQVELYKRSKKRLWERVNLQRQKYHVKEGSQFQHIVCNLGPYLYWLDMPEGESREEGRRLAASEYVSLKRYLDLIEKFPSFRKSEIRRGPRAFPDIQDMGDVPKEYMGPAIYYVTKSRERLLQTKTTKSVKK